MQIIGRTSTPFPYFVAKQCLSLQTAYALLKWFESDAPWTLTRQEFYEQYEFDMFEADLPAEAALLVHPAAIDDMRRLIGQEFNAVLRPQVELVAHKLVAGQLIGIHNDYRPRGETHRLTIQLNRGLADSDGGLLILFNSTNVADVHRILRPVNGTGISFAIGPASYHAVSRVHGGERFTLVYSFHAAEPFERPTAGRSTA